MSLEAHHIIFHARGGLTHPDNGLLVCKNCHAAFHESLVARRLAFEIKRHLRQRGYYPYIEIKAAPEELVQQINAIQQQNVLPTDRFQRINDVIICANFLPCPPDRNFVFGHALLAKVSILSDGTWPLRSNLEDTLESMKNRRLWGQILAAKAMNYGKRINDFWLVARSFHARAVGFNAQNRFLDAVRAHRRLLSYVDGVMNSNGKGDRLEMFRGRILREMGACMAKDSVGSSGARRYAATSLELAKALGDPHDIDDALIRCCETETFLGDFAHAHKVLERLYSDWHRMDANLRAITTKLDARLAIAEGEMANAEELIAQGLAFCREHGVNHQAYHFARLAWHLERGITDRRGIIT